MTFVSNPGHAAPLQLEYWKRHLANHPDQEFSSRLIQQIRDGVSIGYQGNEFFNVCDNWPSSETYRSKVRENILANAAKGRLDGPYYAPPHKYFRGSPLGAFPKKRSEKIRVIHDLSWPPGASINEFINKHDYTVSFATIDQAVALCAKYETPWLTKTDLKDAYMHVKVKPSERHLLGFVWDEPDKVSGEMVREYWQMCVLPFGLTSAPKLFNDLADGLQYIMIQNGASEDLIHYLDDYFAVDGNENAGKNTKSVMKKSIKESGMDAQDEKTLGPFRCLEFLGIVFDTIKKELRISEERLCEIKQSLKDWGRRKVCTKRDLLSLLGKLIFCARVIRDGRKFVGRIIDLSKKVKQLNHKVKLNNQAQADIAWWSACLESHNGVSMFPEEWSITESLVLYTDASDLAAGGVCNNSWFVVPFQDHNDWMASMDIAWRELYAVVVCIATFGKRLTGSKVSMQIDNQAICYCVNSGKSKNPKIMALIRALYYYTSFHHIDYKAFYLSTKENYVADAISRLEFRALKELQPDIENVPVPPETVILDF